MPPTGIKRIFLLVQTATIAVFLGRAWQHIYWDAPYRTLLWDENWMRPVVENWFRASWQFYVTNSDAVIQQLIHSVGWFYVLGALAAIFIKKWREIAVVLLLLGSVSLIFLAALYYKEKSFQSGQFLEYALQWGSPLFLVWLHQMQTVTPRFVLWAKIATALTFISHGLYAVGYYPRPGEFTEMVMIILRMNETNAVYFLKTAGVMDFVASILIFLPGRTGAAGWWYCVVWGFATTIARVWAHFYIDFIPNTLLQWLHESVFRFPHFLIPLALLLWKSQSDRKHLG